ncbi:MAG: DUF4279 domain-containing protein [bacterium]|nr:DUF4279 domain-containing protein [bacterium]
MPRQPPPTDGPEGTVWTGGPVECLSVKLIIVGDELDPVEVGSQLGLKASSFGKKGDAVHRPDGKIVRHRRTGCWILDSPVTPQLTFDEALAGLIEKLPADLAIWHSLTQRYRVAVSCSLLVHGINQGYELSPEVLFALGRLGVMFDVDIFCEPDDQQAADIAERLSDSGD